MDSECGKGLPKGLYKTMSLVSRESRDDPLASCVLHMLPCERDTWLIDIYFYIKSVQG